MRRAAPFDGQWVRRTSTVIFLLSFAPDVMIAVGAGARGTARALGRAGVPVRRWPDRGAAGARPFVYVDARTTPGEVIEDAVQFAVGVRDAAVVVALGSEELPQSIGRGDVSLTARSAIPVTERGRPGQTLYLAVGATAREALLRLLTMGLATSCCRQSVSPARYSGPIAQAPLIQQGRTRASGRDHPPALESP